MFLAHQQVMEHLQGMGDSNACVGRLGYVGSDVLLAAAAVYQHAYGSEWAADYQQQEQRDSGGASGGASSAGSAELDAAAALEYPEEVDDPDFLPPPAAAGGAATAAAAAVATTETREGGREREGGEGGAVGADTEKADADGDDGAVEIPCTFQSIHMIGWKHHESQPKPLPRGSATRSFKELGTVSSDDFK
jgi:hypothetical protein